MLEYWNGDEKDVVDVVDVVDVADVAGDYVVAGVARNEALMNVASEKYPVSISHINSYWCKYVETKVEKDNL